MQNLLEGIRQDILPSEGHEGSHDVNGHVVFDQSIDENQGRIFAADTYPTENQVKTDIDPQLIGQNSDVFF